MLYLRNLRCLSLGLALAGTTAAAPAAAVQKNAFKSISYFDIAQAPSQADWRYFIRAAEREREILWAKHAQIGKKLANWAWGWRLGWVRVCAASTRPLCAAILRDALSDRALVVRAEAASRIGDRFEGSANTQVVTLLEQAFRNPRNWRGGRPLFVQPRILYALFQIGDAPQRERAAALAARHPETRTYWQRLVAATEHASGR